MTRAAVVGDDRSGAVRHRTVDGRDGEHGDAAGDEGRGDCGADERAVALARLGPPDVLFFALFLATAARFELRVAATWLGMTAGLGLTIVATYVFELNGLPGLPAIALGFLLPNADLLWRSLRARDAAPPRPGPSESD